MIDTETAPSAEDVGDDTLANARAALASGHFSIEEAKRTWALSDDEVAQLSKSASPPARTIAQELNEIDKLRTTDVKRYWSPEVQAREQELIGLQMEGKEDHAKPSDATSGRLAAIAEELRKIEETRRNRRSDVSKEMEAQELALIEEQRGLKLGIGALPPGVREEWEENGSTETSLATARETAEAVFSELDDAERNELSLSFEEQLPPAAQAAVFKFIAIEPGNWRPASDEFLAKFSEGDVGGELVREWGQANAAKNVGIIRGRVGMMLKGLSADDQTKALDWLNNLPVRQGCAMLKALVNRR